LKFLLVFHVIAVSKSLGTSRAGRRREFEAAVVDSDLWFFKSL
jgi:hypothetical protein